MISGVGRWDGPGGQARFPKGFIPPWIPGGAWGPGLKKNKKTNPGPWTIEKVARKAVMGSHGLWKKKNGGGVGEKLVQNSIFWGRAVIKKGTKFEFVI